MMKTMLAIMLTGLSWQCTQGAEAPIQLHKKSLKKEIDARAELAAFYKDLIEHNAKVKKQFDQLLRKSPEYGDPHFGPDEPQVVEWIPRTQVGGMEEGYTTDTHFLVVQNISFSRPRQHDSNLVVVSEFHLVQKSKSHAVAGPSGPAATDSDEVTITFLGFRELKMGPAKTNQAERAGASDGDKPPV